MESYVNEDINNYLQWEKEFIIEIKRQENVYKDPDSHSKKLYRDLIIFLNEQEDLYKEKLKGFYKYELSEEPLGVKVIEGDELLFILKTDQLGFSAFGHIYDEYINKSPIKIDAVKDVSRWIYESRSIGGCFLWPMEKTKDGRWQTNPMYNKVRGRGILQDRADMTLQDIKNCYERNNNSWLLHQYNKRNNMHIWLDHFTTIDTFIDFFYFNPFLEGENVKDLSGGVILDFWDRKYKRKFADYHLDELEITLGNLNASIKKRSEYLWKIIMDGKS